MKKPASAIYPSGSNSRSVANRRLLIPALVAAGSVAALPAAAVELGEITVHSSIGQPLRASVAYALGPNEQIGDYCVSLSQGLSSSGLPNVTRAGLSVANGVISLTGSTAIREPLLSARIIVDCPYTAHVSREYMMFVDPPAVSPDLPASPEERSAPRVAAATAAPAAVLRPAGAAPGESQPAAGLRYRVQPGDSLSEIAQRIEDRPVGLWQAVETIFAANPDAFMDNDPNRLKAGSWLLIPDLLGSAVADRAPALTPAVQIAEETATAGADVPASTAYEPAVEPAPPGTVAGADTVRQGTTLAPIDIDAESAAEPAGERPYADLAPGDIVPETIVEAPVEAPAATRPGVIVAPDTAAAAPAGWIAWIGGIGAALIALLLLFGRRLRETFGSTPVGVATTTHPLRRATDGTTQTVGIVEPIEDEEGEFHLSDDSPTDENLALDADLFSGSGLSEASDVDVNQDFGFAVSTELDLELPESTADEQPETDILPPPKLTQTESILESEVLPEDDDYDMSVIVDATKMPDPEDVTQKDFQAVAIDDDEEESLEDSEYTLSHEADYHILEQDYEEELTATQALNLEIEKAAAELAARLDREDEDATTDMKLADLRSLDVTANLRAENDDEGTDVNETLEYDPSESDKTAEMPSADDERTAEMTIERGKVDTKAG